MRLPFATYGRFDLYLSTVIFLGAAAALVLFAPPAWWALVLAGACVFVWLFLCNFFRDPEREIPQGDHLIISPADGVVQDMEVVHDPSYIDEPTMRIGIFLSPLNVHVNRVPMKCTVDQVFLRKGKMLKAFDPRAITENESAAALLSCRDGQVSMLVRQVTGAVARRIVCPVEPGDTFEAGERYGMIKLGSRTEVWLPTSVAVKWNVAIGDKVVGGRTVLGELLESA